MAFTLPELGYAYDALEPHFDARTMEIHHGKHHQTYVNNANAAVEALGMPEFSALSADEVISRIAELPADKQTAVRNNVGGHAIAEKRHDFGRQPESRHRARFRQRGRIQGRI